MLPPYIIEEIRRREEEKQRRRIWPSLELPMEPPPPDPDARDPAGETGQDGDGKGKSPEVDYII